MGAVVTDFCARNSLSEDLRYQLTLVLDELMTNTISYGFAEDAEHSIDLTLSLHSESITVEVEDDGAAFDPFDADPPDLESPLDDRRIGGLGLHIVKTIMDTIEYRRADGRNILVMSKKLATD